MWYDTIDMVCGALRRAKAAEGGEEQMKQCLKKPVLLCLMLWLLCVLSACAYDSTVEDLFTLPRVPDEYTGLSQQLDQLISAGYEYAPPTAGQNIQSVQMEDLDGDGVPEAVVFLRKPNDEKPMKIMVYRRGGDSYEQLCTVESSGSSIDSVSYEDLTGDGSSELIVGWKISSSVQTVAAYNIGREAIPLMSSSYTRYVVQQLNSYDPPALFVLRSDSEGLPVAEIYTWQTNILAVAYRCALSSTMVDLGRGSVVKGMLIGEKPAVFVTGVNDSGKAVTDILAWNMSRGVINLTINETTGKSDAIRPYRQLIPQDLNGDGVTEVPCPDASSTGNDMLTDWVQYSRTGYYFSALQTYHCQSGGWYFLMPESWRGRVRAESAETVAGENQVTLYVDETPVLALYTITNDSRENRAVMGERFLLRRQPGTIYAAELYEDAGWYGMDTAAVQESFHLAVTDWSPSDS